MRLPYPISLRRGRTGGRPILSAPAGKRSRRTRRGVSIIEAALVFALSAFAVAAGAGILSQLGRTADRLAEARAVSAAAEALAAESRRGVPEYIAAARAAGGAVLLDPRDFPGIDAALTAGTPAGLPLRWAHYAPDAETLLIIVWAAGDPGTGPRPVPGSGIVRTGVAGGSGAGCADGHWCGDGLDYDASGFTAALGGGEPRAGETVAMRDLSFARTDRRILQRGGTDFEYDVMNAPLTVTGTVTGVNEIQAGEAEAEFGIASAGGNVKTGLLKSAVMTKEDGTDTTGMITAAGDVTAGGALTAGGSAFELGAVAAGSGSFASAAAEGNLETEGDARFADVTVAAAPGSPRPGKFGAASLTAGGSVSAVSGALRRGEALSASQPLTADIGGGAVFGQLAAGTRADGFGLIRLSTGGWLFVDRCNGC